MRNWFTSVYLTELRRMFSYRVDFWVQFVGTVTGEILIAYFLWDALFTLNGGQKIGGYTFSTTIVYYIFSAFIGRIVMGTELGNISVEIYDGSLTRYLLYPVNYVKYNLARRLANCSLTLIQMFLGLTLIIIFIKPPIEIHFLNFLMGVFYILAGSLFYFLLGVIIELISFWADNVWSLTVMYRFISQFLGGMYIPLAMYPEWSKKYLFLTPFPYMGSEPIKMFMNQLSYKDFYWGLSMLMMWSIPLLLILKIVWGRGTRQYSGVGI